MGVVKGLVEYEDKYRVNIDFFPHFFASFLDIPVPKGIIFTLTKEIFPCHYLGGLGKVVTNFVYGIVLPRVSDLWCHIEEYVVVPWEPVLSGLYKMIIKENYQRVSHACHFIM
jgi:hypothetical protein